MPLFINSKITIPDEALSERFTRASGPGGQNVNKVSSRVELSVEVAKLPIPAPALQRLRALAGKRLTASGVLLIASQSSRDQAANRAACAERLRALVLAALEEPEIRRPTRPSRASRRQRVESKKRRGATKAARSRRPAEES
ncbi:MAG: aminoacyl-tRNA hydrolase [Candidatus Wallbacteria bacterium]|nr:aminoacyl-tRNA hydrolase [Candidatus Wallbacteria bacterium]